MDLLRHFTQLEEKLEENTLLLKELLNQTEKKSDKPKKKYLSRNEAADYLNCSVPQIDNLRKKGELTGIVKGSKVYMTIDELERYMNSNCEKFAKPKKIKKVQN